MLCDDLEGWDGSRGGREVQEGGDMCILMADSHCCMAETNKQWKAIIFQLKINSKISLKVQSRSSPITVFVS